MSFHRVAINHLKFGRLFQGRPLLHSKSLINTPPSAHTSFSYFERERQHFWQESLPGKFTHSHHCWKLSAGLWLGDVLALGGCVQVKLPAISLKERKSWGTWKSFDEFWVKLFLITKPSCNDIIYKNYRILWMRNLKKWFKKIFQFFIIFVSVMI